MAKYVVTYRCPNCGYKDEGIMVEAEDIHAARATRLNCPNNEGEEMHPVRVKEE